MSDLTCPTCGSSKPEVRFHRHINSTVSGTLLGAWHFDTGHGGNGYSMAVANSCPDSWHDAITTDPQPLADDVREHAYVNPTTVMLAEQMSKDIRPSDVQAMAWEIQRLQELFTQAATKARTAEARIAEQRKEIGFLYEWAATTMFNSYVGTVGGEHFGWEDEIDGVNEMDLGQAHPFIVAWLKARYAALTPKTEEKP